MIGLTKVIGISPRGGAVPIGATITFLRDGAAQRHGANVKTAGARKGAKRYTVAGNVLLRVGEQALISDDEALFMVKIGAAKLVDPVASVTDDHDATQDGELGV